MAFCKQTATPENEVVTPNVVGAEAATAATIPDLCDGGV